MQSTDSPAPTPSTSPSTQKLDPMTLTTMLAVVIMLGISLMNMWNLNRVANTLSERVAKLEAIVSGGPEPAGPDPGRTYTVRIEGAPIKGPEAAPITIAEFSEFQCPFCLKVDPTIKRIEEIYRGQVRVVWKHFPLSIHQNALDAALAAEAARNQNKFWEYHDKLFANQKKLDVESLKQYAAELQLDMARFERDRLDPEIRKRVEADVTEANTLGVNSTPSFFINGRFVRGAQPFETFAKLIDDELTKRNLPVPPKPSTN